MCVCGGFNLDQLPFSEGTQFLLATFHAVQQIKKKKKYILLTFKTSYKRGRFQVLVQQ